MPQFTEDRPSGLLDHHLPFLNYVDGFQSNPSALLYVVAIVYGTLKRIKPKFTLGSSVNSAGNYAPAVLSNDSKNKSYALTFSLYIMLDIEIHRSHQ